MALLLLATALCGTIVNRYLFLNVIRELWLRYSTSIVCPYLVFLGLIRVWLIYVSALFRPLELSEDEPSESAKPTGVSRKNESFWDGSGLELVDWPGDECGCLIMVLIALLMCIFAGAGFLIFAAPEILADAAFDFFLAAGLIRSFRRLEQPNWTQSVLSTTWKPFAMVLLVSIVFGFIANGVCPQAATITEVIFGCRK